MQFNNKRLIIGFVLTALCFSSCEKDPFADVKTKELPEIAIETQNDAAISSNITYLKATIKIDGKKTFKNFKGSTQVRGRGNSTWYFDKKPYRIKLDSEASILGLAVEKDWVLLANYLDGSLMLNAVAMKIGQLLEMPYTNHIIPVDLTVNGQYQGSYMLTEQVEAKKNRVNVGEDGFLFSLDRNYDDVWKFKTNNYQLPVLIKHPELTSAAQISSIKADFDRFESLIVDNAFPNNGYQDYFDTDAFANYLIVYLLTDNQEINHPKSTYLYKTKTGKYTMGPIWDFDWAFSFEKTFKYFSKYDQPLFWPEPAVGKRFFERIASDPKNKELLKQKWAKFKVNKFKDLLLYVDEYATLIDASRKKDFSKWKQGDSDLNVTKSKLKQWLQNRADFLDGHIGSM